MKEVFLKTLIGLTILITVIFPSRLDIGFDIVESIILGVGITLIASVVEDFYNKGGE